MEFPEIHRGSVWHTTTPERYESIAGYLASHVDLSPYFTKDDDFVPLRCITHSVAKWSFEVAVLFIDGFYELMGIASILEIHRDRLKLEPHID